MAGNPNKSMRTSLTRKPEPGPGWTCKVKDGGPARWTIESIDGRIVLAHWPDGPSGQRVRLTDCHDMRPPKAAGKEV